MSEWPEGWYRDSPSRAPSEGNASDAGPADPTVRLSAGRPGTGQPGGLPGTGYRGGDAPPGGWPQQPPPQTGRPARGSGRGSGRRGWRRPGRWIKIIASLVVLILIISVGLYFYLDSKLHRQNVLIDYRNRPAASAGQNWLITGSDSRQGLTRAQERKYSTGPVTGGKRSDTIMLLHVPSNGTRAVLVSLPRDSYVPIPGYGYNKINAAYSFGGPKLLAETVQNLTGLRIDHYMGIGFGGFVNVVNSIGGVTMCLPAPLHDKASGLNLKAGCQTMSGGEALSYVRDRHSFAATQDLQRVQDQRIFVKALLAKLTSTGTILNPFASVPAAFGTAGNLTVDSGTHLYQLLQVAFALRNPETTTAPIANPNYVTSAGDAVLLDAAAAHQLFHDLGTDRPVPKRLLTGSALPH